MSQVTWMMNFLAQTTPSMLMGARGGHSGGNPSRPKKNSIARWRTQGNIWWRFGTVWAMTYVTRGSYGRQVSVLPSGIHRRKLLDFPRMSVLISEYFYIWVVTCAPPPLPAALHFLSVYFFSVSFCPCLPGPLGLDNLPPTSPPCPLPA